MSFYERFVEYIRTRRKERIKSLDANTEIQCPRCGKQIRIKQEQDSSWQCPHCGTWQAPAVSKDLKTPPI